MVVVLGDPGQAKVAKFGVEFMVQECVAWFDISVQDVWATLVVEVMKSGPYALRYFVPHCPWQYVLAFVQVVVEIAISHKFIDKEELDILFVGPPKHEIAYAAAPAFEPHHVPMARLTDGDQLRKEVLEISPGVLVDSLDSHILLLETPFVYHAEATLSDLIFVGEPVRCDTQIAVLESLNCGF